MSGFWEWNSAAVTMTWSGQGATLEGEVASLEDEWPSSVEKPGVGISGSSPGGSKTCEWPGYNPFALAEEPMEESIMCRQSS